MNSDKQAVRAVLAPDGVLRVAINYGNIVLAQRSDNETPNGVSAELARALAAELNAEIEYAEYDIAGDAVANMDEAGWRIAFLARDPSRAETIHFTQSYVLIEGTYIVHDNASFQQVADLDAKDVRIAVGKGAAYDLFLSRELKHAELERAATSAAAIDLFVEQKLSAAAGVRQPLNVYAAKHAGFRVLDGYFTAIEQCMALPKNCAEAAGYVEDFLTRQIKNSFVREALDNTGQQDAQVASR